MIKGDSYSRDYGLEICTDCYSLPYVVRLFNVLTIPYELNCTVILKISNQYRLNISFKSKPRLRVIVGLDMHPSMLYKVYCKYKS